MKGLYTSRITERNVNAPTNTQSIDFLYVKADINKLQCLRKSKKIPKRRLRFRFIFVVNLTERQPTGLLLIGYRCHEHPALANSYDLEHTHTHVCETASDSKLLWSH